MKTKVSRQELKECVTNAVKRVMSEGAWKNFGNDRQQDNKHERDRNFDKKKSASPKHQKMTPFKKEKYRSYED